MIFLTTNHLERLDPALIRPGRVDVKLEVGWATPSQMRSMFLRFFPGAQSEADEFVARIQRACESRRSRGERADLSMAELQGFFLVHKHSMHTALESVHQIHDVQTQTAIAASFVTSITAASAAAQASGAAPPPSASASSGASSSMQPQTPGQPRVEKVVAVPDMQMSGEMVREIQRRIEAEVKAAEEAKTKAVAGGAPSQPSTSA